MVGAGVDFYKFSHTWDPIPTCQAHSAPSAINKVCPRASLHVFFRSLFITELSKAILWYTSCQICLTKFLVYFWVILEVIFLIKIRKTQSKPHNQKVVSLLFLSLYIDGSLNNILQGKQNHFFQEHVPNSTCFSPMQNWYYSLVLEKIIRLFGVMNVNN